MVLLSCICKTMYHLTKQCPQLETFVRLYYIYLIHLFFKTIIGCIYINYTLYNKLFIKAILSIFLVKINLRFQKTLIISKIQIKKLWKLPSMNGTVFIQAVKFNPYMSDETFEKSRLKYIFAVRFLAKVLKCRKVP